MRLRGGRPPQAEKLEAWARHHGVSVDLVLARYWGCYSPAAALASQARDVQRKQEHPPGPVRTLRDMTDAEITALERLYGCPVQRRKP